MKQSFPERPKLHVLRLLATANLPKELTELPKQVRPAADNAESDRRNSLRDKEDPRQTLPTRNEFPALNLAKTERLDPRGIREVLDPAK